MKKTWAFVTVLLLISHITWPGNTEVVSKRAVEAIRSLRFDTIEVYYFNPGALTRIAISKDALIKNPDIYLRIKVNNIGPKKREPLLDAMSILTSLDKKKEGRDFRRAIRILSADKKILFQVFIDQRGLTGSLNGSPVSGTERLAAWIDGLSE